MAWRQPLGGGGRVPQLPGRRPDPRRARSGVQRRRARRDLHEHVVAGDPDGRAQRPAVREDRVLVDRRRAPPHRARTVVGRARCRRVVALRLRRRSAAPLFVPFGAVVRGRAPRVLGLGHVGARERAQPRVARRTHARGGDRHPHPGVTDVGPARARGRRAPRSGPARTARPGRCQRRRDRRRALVTPSARCGARVPGGRVLRASRSATRSSAPGTTARSFRTPRSPRTRAACTGRRVGTISSTLSRPTGCGSRCSRSSPPRC